jgi:cytochrome o ubiquinol oxidase subunit IV
MSNVKQGSTYSYTVGFILSLFFTLVPYLMVTRDVATGWIVPAALTVFAIAQVFVQLIFFLHLGQERKPRWHNITFGFMLMVIIIVIFGSLWIMNNLNYNTMTPQDTNTYIQHEEGISR